MLLRSSIQHQDILNTFTGHSTLTPLTAGTAYTLGMGAGALKAGTPGTNFGIEREGTVVNILMRVIIFYCTALKYNVVNHIMLYLTYN